MTTNTNDLKLSLMPPLSKSAAPAFSMSLSELLKKRVHRRIKRSLVNCAQIRSASLANEDKVKEGKEPQKKLLLKSLVAGEKNKKHDIVKYQASKHPHLGLQIKYCIEFDGRPTLPSDHPKKEKMTEKIGLQAATCLLQLLDDESSTPIPDQDMIVLFRKVVYSKYDLDSETLDQMDALHFIREAQRQKELDSKKNDVLLPDLVNVKDDIKAHVGNVGSEVVEQVVDRVANLLDKANAKPDKMGKKIDRLISLLVVVLLFIIIVGVVIVGLVFLVFRKEPAITGGNLVEKIGDLYTYVGGNLTEKIGGLYTNVRGNLAENIYDLYARVGGNLAEKIDDLYARAIQQIKDLYSQFVS